jgi:hypothetical protein
MHHDEGKGTSSHGPKGEDLHDLICMPRSAQRHVQETSWNGF